MFFTGWAETRPTAGVSAAFISANSVAGLVGNIASAQSLPNALPVWALAADAGVLVSTQLGACRLANKGIRRALAGILLVTGLKLMLT